MRIHFTNKPLDQLQIDCAVIGCFAEERPLLGVAGLIDWRMYGFLSRAIQKNHFSAQDDETVLIPASDRLPCRWLILQGLGSALELKSDKVQRYSKQALLSALKLNCRSMAIFYPHLLTKAPYQQNSLRWLLEGLSATAATYSDSAAVETLKILIPSLYEEEIDLATTMMPKLLARHTIQASA
jgi:hypothetical protein